MEFTEVFRIMAASFIILFLPGFIWTYMFFNNIDLSERIALGFAISIAIVPLIIFFLNQYFGMKVTATNSFLVIFLFCISGFVLALVNFYRRGC